MGFNFSRIKNWLGYDNITNTDLNNEFNNIIQKAGSDTLSSANSTNGSSPTVTAMQTTSNPGGVGTENLSSTTQVDIQQLRYMINEIIGGAQWYSTPPNNLTQIQSELTNIATFPPSRVVSGRLPSGNNQPMFLVPDGTAATVYLRATTTPFVAYFNGTQETFSTDITTTSLSLAPSSNNTATVSDSNLTGQNSSYVQGENGTSISISSLGSNITALDGKFAAFKHSTEYFVAQVENGTTTYATPTGTTGVTVTGSLVSSSPIVLSLSTTSGFYAGMSVTGSGIPSNTTILSVNLLSKSMVLSNNATSTGSQTLTCLGTTLTNVSSIAGVQVGQTVSGTGIASGTQVVLIFNDQTNGTCILLSQATTSVASATTLTFTWYRLKNAFRGVGFSSADAWFARTAVSSGDTITLMKLTWVFATYNSLTAGVSLTYNEPVISYTQPSSPAIGDYWYNLSTSTWSVYNSTVYVATNAVFVGICIQDTSGCKAARSTDFFKFFSGINNLEPACLNSTNIYVPSLSSKISVYGNQYYFDKSQPIWNTTNNLLSGLSLAASTTYYCYVTDQGNLQIDVVQPTARKFDLLGAYHPKYPWRCVCDFGTDGSENVIASSLNIYPYHERILPSYGSGILGPGSISGSQIATGAISSSQIATGGIIGGNIANQTITRQNLVPTGFTTSSSSSTFTMAGTTPTAVTNLSVTLTTTGNPVYVFLSPDGTSNAASIQMFTSSNSSTQLGFVEIIRDGIVIFIYELIGAGVSGGGTSLGVPPSIIFCLDKTLNSGSHTYTVSVYGGASYQNLNVYYTTLNAYEIK